MTIETGEMMKFWNKYPFLFLQSCMTLGGIIVGWSTAYFLLPYTKGMHCIFVALLGGISTSIGVVIGALFAIWIAKKG